MDLQVNQEDIYKQVSIPATYTTHGASLSLAASDHASARTDSS